MMKIRAVCRLPALSLATTLALLAGERRVRRIWPAAPSLTRGWPTVELHVKPASFTRVKFLIHQPLVQALQGTGLKEAA